MEFLAAMLGEYVYKHTSSASFSCEVYKYSIEIILETAAGIIASILIAVYLDMKLEGVVFFAEFFLLRSYAGGLHFDKFRNCFICSSLVVFGVLWVVKHVPVSLMGSCILLIFTVIAFWRTKQTDDKNRQVQMDEAIYFKKKLMHTLLVTIAAYFILAAVGQAEYAFLIALTAAVVYVMMLIGKWR